MRDSSKHKTWVSSNIGKKNWLNDLFLHGWHYNDENLISEMVNIGLKRLRNQGWKDDKPSFYYPLLQWEIVSTC